MIPAVVIGGERRIVDEDVTPRLKKHGLDVIDVFPMDKEMGDLPRGAEVFVLLTNMMSHRHNDFAKAEAERRGNVKVVYGSSKGSLLVRRLIAAGYPEVKPPAPGAEPPAKTTAVSNPRLPGGFYEAELVGSDMDENYLYVMLQIQNDPVYGGAVYTDVLISRKDYAKSEGLDRVYDFVRTLGIPAGKTGKGVEEFRRSTDELWGRPVWFHAAPAGNGTRITYYEKSQWALKSAAQRRRRASVVAAPPLPVSPVTPVPPVTPVTPVREEEPMSSTRTLRVAPDATAFAPGSLYHRVLSVLAVNPSLTRDETAESVNCSTGSTFSTMWTKARKELGIASVRTGPVTIDRPVYEAACATLGVTPVVGATFYRERKPPAPQLTILPPPPVAPTPKVESPSVTEPPKDDLAEIREILALLRDEMVKRDIRQMVVTPEGVDFTRVVTVSGKMEF